MDGHSVGMNVALGIDEAVEFAEKGEWEPVSDLLKDLYTPADFQLKTERPL